MELTLRRETCGERVAAEARVGYIARRARRAFGRRGMR